MKKKRKYTAYAKLCAMAITAGALLPNPVFTYAIHANDNQIGNLTIMPGSHSAPSHGAELAVDGDKSTYYQTPASKSMEDHYRYIDIDLGGLYDLTAINVFNNVDGSYSHYEIYASTNGKDFNKIAWKANDEAATEQGDHFDVKAQASIIRINMSWNSKRLEGNLAEIEVYGNRVSDSKLDTTPISVTNFADTKWADEYAKVETDEAYAQAKTIAEMKNMVGRVIGDEYKDAFSFSFRPAGISGKDVFEVSTDADGIVQIAANNGIGMASGFNYYLKNFCNVDYDPVFASHLDMPETLPAMSEKVVKETQYDLRYALNYCTYSYTMAFWDWNEYESFLDWAAMNGINLILDIVGQEEIVRRTLSAYGYSDHEIKEYIAGPGYFAWFYMQNMTSYGGMLPDSWFENRVELGRRIHDRMQTYGITPVLSGFSGQVPVDFKTRHTDAQIVAQGEWCSYQRPDMLRTYVSSGADYFDEMADEFYKASHDVFGDVTHYYSVDPFHEGGRMGDMNPTIVYETIQNKMLEHDDQAVWLIQEWSGSIANNTNKLTNLDKEHVVVLDLFSEISPRNSALEKAQTPWVWNMLHNFGGRMGLDGNPEKIANEPSKTFAKSNYMKGIGMTPEAIENAPMVYELLFENTWSKDPIDYREWINGYAERRYGGINDDIKEAWEILLDTAYATRSGYYQGAAESVFNTRPRTDFSSASSWGHSSIPFDKEELEKAVNLFAKHYDEFKDSPAFIYDFSDLLRQVLQDSAADLYAVMIQAYNDDNLELFKTTSSEFMDMIELMDRVLAANPDFLVGTWIENARTMVEGADDWTNDLFEYNARSLITTWGSKAQSNGGLRDYSNRQWAGLTKDYYAPRWQMFIDDTIKAMENGTAKPTLNSYDWFVIESKWSTAKSDQTGAYATEASGENLVDLADTVMKKYTISAIRDLAGSVQTQEIISGGKTVTVEGAETAEGSSSANLTDGSKETSWKASSSEKTFSLTIDLEELASITGVEIAMEQIPTMKPYNYTIEVFNNDQWTTVASKEEGMIDTNDFAQFTAAGTKVRVNFDRQDESILPEVFELSVFGTSEDQGVYKNVAAGKNVILDEGSKAGSSPTSRPLSNITDDDPSTIYASTNGQFPANLTVEMGEPEYVEYMEVYFEREQLGFEFEAAYTNAQGERIVVRELELSTTPGVGNPRMIRIPIKDEVLEAHVDLKSWHTAPGSNSLWAGLAEIKLMQPVEELSQGQNLSRGKTGKVINADKTYETTRLTDGNFSNLENVGYSIFPTAFEVDLGREENLNKVNVFFEKAGLRFQYKVIVREEDGTEHLIADMSDNLADMQATYEYPTDVRGRYVVVDIVGRAPGGSFYLASPALLEIEAWGTSSSILADANASSDDLTGEELDALKDGNKETGFTMTSGRKVVEFTLDEPKDVYAYELKTDGTSPMQYKVEIQTLEGDWVTAADASGNISAKRNYIGQFDPISAQAVRLSLEGAGDVYDFNLLAYNSASDLAAIVTSFETKFKNTASGDLAGQYPQDAWNEMNAILSEVKEMTKGDVTMAQAKEQEARLSAAWKKYVKSVNTLDRGALLSVLDQASALLKNELFVNYTPLKEAYDSGMAVYNTLSISQAQIDEAASALKPIVAFAAKGADLADLAAQGRELNEADYPAANWAVFKTALDQAQAAIDSLDKQTLETLTTAYDALSTAMANLGEEVKVDVSCLEWLVNTVKDASLDLYQDKGKDTFRTALEKAQEILESKESQEAVNNAAGSLNRSWMELRLTPDENLLKERYQSEKN